MSVFDKVKEVIIDELGVEEHKIVTEANVIEDLDADSLSVMEIVMALEEEYDIEVPEDEIMKLKTVGDVVKYVEDNK